MKKIIVLSLGGSLIIPNKINIEFLENFREVLIKNSRKYKFIVVCGGGQTARNYIQGLEQQKISNKILLQSFLGIASTRLNARFMTYFFGKDANKGMPHDMKDVYDYLRKNDIVFCGALRYAKKQTSDATATKLAHHFNTIFINITNTKGLYDRNPKKFRSAKFIPEISHKNFYKMANKIAFHPGQHFVLDQSAAKIIKDYNIPTYIIGDSQQLNNLLNRRHFIGTIVG